MRQNSTSGNSAADAGARLTVDELARAARTTTRQVRALQTRGLLSHPSLVGRTGYYDTDHLDRLRAILRLQDDGFSLGALGALMRAWEANMTLAQVLGLHSPDPLAPDEFDAFGDLLGSVDWPPPHRGRLLWLVPSTILDQPAAS